MSFTKKVVIVTGASSGIGAATAKSFAKEGADVVLADRDEVNLAIVSAEITKLGNKPLIIKADVSKDDEAKRIINETINKYGKLDILVNNAGFLTQGNLLDGKILNAYDAVMSTNLRAVVHLTSLAAPHLIKSKGNIVNISSGAGTATPTLPDFLIYSTSKAGLNHFSRGAAFELAAHGVRVNIVSPGATNTNFSKNSGWQIGLKDLIPDIPLKRLLEPQEVADVIMFLASEKAKGITGSEFVVDNGSLLGSPRPQ